MTMTMTMHILIPLMPYLIAFSIVLFFFIQFLTCHCNWLLKKIHFIHSVGDVVRNQFADARNTKEILPCSYVVENALWTYNKSLLYFWIWNFDEMDMPKELYEQYN